MTKKENRIYVNSILVVTFLILILYITKQLELNQSIQLIFTFTLMAITLAYVNRTAEIAKATREQTEASLKMAEEMKAQREISTQPVIIQRIVHRNYSQGNGEADYFEVYNAGNSPAIELEMSLLDEEKVVKHSERTTFLNSKEAAIDFKPFTSGNFTPGSYYLVSEYQSIFSVHQRQCLYQTWLPLKVYTNRNNNTYTIAGELEFKNDLPETERIDAFTRWEKPK